MRGTVIGLLIGVAIPITSGVILRAYDAANCGTQIFALIFFGGPLGGAIGAGVGFLVSSFVRRKQSGRGV